VPIDDAKFDPSILGSTANFIVPLLAPVNAEFSHQFRAIEGVYTGTVISPKKPSKCNGVVGIALPFDLVPNSLKQIARGELPDRLYRHVTDGDTFDDILIASADVTANDSNANGKNSVDAGLAITAEMVPLGLDKIDSCCAKALKFKKNILNPDPQVKKHVHLVFTSKIATKNDEAVPSVPLAKRTKTEGMQRENTDSERKSNENEDEGSGYYSEEAENENEEVGSDYEENVDLTKCRVFVASFVKRECQICLERLNPPANEDAADGLVDVIIVPIETMFVHALVK
jgi:hypothetical protein